MKSKPVDITKDANRASLDDKIEGVKTFGSIAKNANSVSDYHILSNLEKQKHNSNLAYDGERMDADIKKTSS